MLNSVVLISWFCFRNDVDLCHLANADAMKKEKKIINMGWTIGKKSFREAAFGGVFLYFSCGRNFTCLSPPHIDPR